MNLLGNILRAFRHKNYSHYFIWQILSFTGTWIQSTAQSWLVYRLTGSPVFLGLVGFASSIPALIFSPFSGVISDQFKRKNVLLLTQILCLIQAVVLAVLFFSGVINKWHVLYLAIFVGIVNSFDVTARQSFIPLLIAKEDLLNAIALNSSMFNAARMIGPAIAGILISTYGEGACFALNVLSYVPIIVFLFWVSEKKQTIKHSISPFNHLMDGISFAWNNQPIRALLFLIGTVSFFGMSFSTLMPIFSDQILKSGAKGLGILMGASGVGAVIGGLFLASRQKVIGVKKIIAFCSILFSLCLVIFSFSKSFVLSLVMLSIIGFCFMIINAGSNTAMQAMSPDNLRGRIIGLYTMMFMGVFPLGSLAIGLLAHKFGVQMAVLIGAIICLIAGICFSFIVPKLTKQARSLFDAQESVETVIEQVG